MPTKIEKLESLACNLIGDGQTPGLFFVTDCGAVVCIETDIAAAHARFRQLANRRPRKECTLENRTWGVIASVEPETDWPKARLVLFDDVNAFRRRKTSAQAT